MVWRGPSTTCSSVLGSLCRHTHPVIWRLLGRRPRGSCGSAVVAAADGASPSASGCWACSHKSRSATTTREHIWRQVARCRPTRASRCRWAGRCWVSRCWPGEDEDLDEAWELAHEGLEVLDDYGDRVGAAAALETIADLAVTLGEPERSLRLLAASQRFHTDTGLERFPLEGDRFGRAHEAAQAALDDTDATACWDAGGELALADAVAYARRGRGERQRPQIGWASLTPAELDVVRLVAEGHTNAEIGQRLFISVNTVKKHLSRVYAKVDVDGRADLAAQVARRDL